MAHHPRRPPLPQPVFAEPTFAEDTKSPDPLGFQTKHPSDDPMYKRIEEALSHDVVGFPPSRLAAGEVFPFTTALGPHGEQITDVIRKAGRIVFHAVGDTGSSDTRNYSDELRVADQLGLDCETSNPADRPVFLFHLGDIVYSFGEAKYYYDQFYEPFRAYRAPIFAIPGNHDSFVTPGTAPADEPLVTFRRNFCSEETVITPEAGSLHRTAMTQPGVYFALDAPFVRIIGLFCNALEDPGLISSEGGHWPGVPDVQLDYLAAQLQRVRDEKYAGAVLIATHHPPFSYELPPGTPGVGGNHASSSDMLRQIDGVCKQQGVYPHAFLSAHAHNYQRYTRTVRFNGADRDVPFVVCGSGGHNINPLVRARHGQKAQEPDFGAAVDYLEDKPAVETGGLVLEKYDDRNYGYLRVSVDSQSLRIGFHQVTPGGLAQSRFDLVTVDLASHTIVAN